MDPSTNRKSTVPPPQEHVGESLERLVVPTGAAALPPIPEAPSLNELSNPQILRQLEWYANREKFLQAKVVTDSGLEAWRADWAAFTELRGTDGARYLAEAVRRGIAYDQKPYLEVVKEVSEAVRDAVATREEAVLRLIAVHTPKDSHEHLFGKNILGRELALLEWRSSLENEGRLRQFHEAIALERAKEGEGVAHLRKRSSQKNLRATEPRAQEPQPEGRVAAFLKMLGEDSFQFPRIWRGDFSFIKPQHRRKANRYAN